MYLFYRIIYLFGSLLAKLLMQSNFILVWEVLSSGSTWGRCYFKEGPPPFTCVVLKKNMLSPNKIPALSGVIFCSVAARRVAGHNLLLLGHWEPAVSSYFFAADLLRARSDGGLDLSSMLCCFLLCVCVHLGGP